MKPLVVFDFDGTIADTFLLALDIFYRVTDHSVLLRKSEINRLRGMALIEVARELKVPYWKMPYLVFRGRKMLAKQMSHVKLIDGMSSVLRALKRDGYGLYIISSNSRDNIDTFITQHKLELVFDSIFADARLRGKARLLRKLARQTGRKPADMIYVGDETRDIEAAHRAGVHSIAVTWGYNSAKALRRHKPDNLVFEPTKLRRCINNNQS